MKILNFTLLLFLLTNFCKAQPSIQWQKCYGGSSLEGGATIQQTPDGGFIAAGEARSKDGDVTGIHINAPLSNEQHPDFWVIKIDSMGNLQWQKCLGGTQYDQSTCIKTTSDGGYIVGGITTSNDGDVTGFHSGSWDFWLVKLDSIGNLQWQKVYGGSGSEVLQDLVVTSDNGFVCIGAAGSIDYDVTGNHGSMDIWILKTDSLGNMLWQKCYGGSAYDYGNSIKQTSDGGFIIAGESESADGDMTFNNGINDFCLLKVDSIGNLIWQKSYGGTSYDWAKSVVPDNNNGYIVAGGTFSNDSTVNINHGNSDFWIIRTDALGNLIWQKCFGGTGDDRAISLIKTNDGNFVASGYSDSNDGDVNGNLGGQNFWVLKFDILGNLLWNKCYGGINTTIPYSIIQTTNWGYALAGIAFGNSGNVSGNHSPAFGDLWVLRLYYDEFSADINTSVDEIELMQMDIIYPNPATDNFTISLKGINKKVNITISDLSGKIIYETTSINAQKIEVNTKDFAAGVFAVQIQTGDFVETRKLMVVK